MHLGCGLSVGMTGLAAGYCIGIVGDKGVRSYMEQSRVFVGMVLILIFGEVLGLYGYVFSLSFLHPPPRRNLESRSSKHLPCHAPQNPSIYANDTHSPLLASLSRLS